MQWLWHNGKGGDATAVAQLDDCGAMAVEIVMEVEIAMAVAGSMAFCDGSGSMVRAAQCQWLNGKGRAMAVLNERGGNGDDGM